MLLVKAFDKRVVLRYNLIARGKLLVTDGDVFFTLASTLILSFEEAFGMRAKYEDLMKIITVGDIVDYLKKIQSAP